MDDLVLYIEKGVENGHEYVIQNNIFICECILQKYRGSADEFVNTRPGEVVFKIETLPHPTYTRDGNNLKTTVKITLKQALLGFTKELEHLDDHVVYINKKKVTKPGEVEKIKGEGMPMYDYSSEQGDLYITYEVEFPKTLSSEQKECK